MTLSTIRALKETFKNILEAKIEILKIENFSKGTPLDRDFGHFEASRKPLSWHFWGKRPSKIDKSAPITPGNVFSESQST